MKKKKFLLLFSLLTTLVMALALVACTDYTKDETPEESTPTVKFEQLVTNGTFYDAKSTNSNGFYDVVEGWTQTSAASTTAASGTGRNESTGIISAVVDLASGMTDTILNTWQIDTKENETDEGGNPVRLDTPIKLENPKVDPATPQTDKLDEKGNPVKNGDTVVRENRDTNALLLATTMTKGSHYMAGGSYTLEANSLYRLQFSVCSKVENENSGAFVFVRGDVDYEFNCINTDGAWKTYEFFIETNRTSSMSIKLELWLGYGPAAATSQDYANDGNDKYATRGFALFDNVICKKVVDEAEDEYKEIAFSDVYKQYDKEDDLHKNYLAFVASDAFLTSEAKTVSAYYFIDANLTNRSHLTSSTYFTGNTYRSYFYGFRDYSSSNISSSYWSLNADSNSSAASSLGSSYYGVVDPTRLYKGKETTDDQGQTTTTYTNGYTSITPMASEEWLKSFINTAENEYDFNGLDEHKVLMLYNSSLRPSGYTSAKSIKIDANTYYAVSVWAYVWAKQYTGTASYNGTDSYMKAYATAEPTDPTSASSTTYTALEKAIYNLFIESNKDTPTVTLPKDYFGEVTAESFDGTAFVSKLKGEAIPNTTETQYSSLLTSVKNWLGSSQGMKDVGDSYAERFFYTYLYYAYTEEDGERNVVPSPAMTAAKIESYFDNAEDALAFITNGYMQERYNNNKTVNAIKKSYESYLAELDNWTTAKAAYVAQCKNWEENNPDGPSAMLKLTGAGDNIKATTTKVGEWEKITVYVQGNQLSARELTVNLVFGEGLDTNNQMIGGVFFDNIEVVEYDEKPDDVKINVLSEINSKNQITFGGLAQLGDLKPTLEDWTQKAIKGTATDDNNKVALSYAKEDDVKTIEVAGDNNENRDTYTLFVLTYENTEKTASTLVYSGNSSVKIGPNKFYRFAFLMKTEGVDEKLGVTVSLLKGENEKVTEENGTSLTSFSAYTTEEKWQEIVYYIQGDLSKTWYLTVKVDMGSGSRMEPDNYVKGAVKLASFNCLEIDYDEYSSANTGDKITGSLSVNSVSSNISKDSVNIANATYATVDYNKTDADQFDSFGQLTGIGATKDWTKGTVVGNTFDTITTLQKEYDEKIGYSLTWTAVKGGTENEGAYKEVDPEYYEIWVKYEDNGKEYNKLYDYVAGDVTKYTIKETNLKTCSFGVKAVGKTGVSTLGAGNYVAISNTGTKNPTPQYNAAEYAARKVEAGTIVIDREEFFEDVSSVEKYSSEYSTLLKITSTYDAAVNMKSGSFSLPSDGYYKVSVWAKTEGGAKATIALTSSSGSLIADVDDDIIGYSLVDTDGEWKEYCFYVKTSSNFSVSMNVNLGLGNPFANTKSGLKADNKSDVDFYTNADLSSGTVYFDAVRIVTIAENVYTMAKDVYGEAKSNDEAAVLPIERDGVQLKFLYKDVDSYIYTMEYTTDSFDSSTSTSSKEFGNTPNNYDRNYVTTLTSNSTNATYGVYDSKSTSGDMEEAIEFLYTNSTATESAYNKYFATANCEDTALNTDGWTDEKWNEFMQDFLKVDAEDGTKGGNNVLVMSNKLSSGFAQNYTLDSSYKCAIKTDAYYKFTFTAKTLIAVPQYTKDAKAKAKEYYDAGTWEDHRTEFYLADGTQIDSKANYDEKAEYRFLTYSMADAYGELRFTTGETDAKPLSVFISSYDKDATGNPAAKTYTIYLHNPEKGTSSSASWAFYLGDDTNKVHTELNKKLVGMMAIDLVSLDKIDKDAYEAGIAAIESNYDEKGKVIDAKASTLKYEYGEVEESDDDEDDGDDEPTEEDEQKDDFWTNLINDQYFWLYISSFVLGLIIIVVVIVVLVRNFQKKHPKEKVFENNVKTAKEIKVAEPEPQVKEDALEADDYVDEIDVKYTQRKVQKKKKKK